MKVELHILQNFAPSNLNRDDTGTPKSCEFGGHRRARVSSQSLKRAARQYARERGLLDERAFGKRSLLFKTELVKRLVEKNGQNECEAQYVADFILAKTKLIEQDKKESGYLLFLGEAQFEQIRGLCEQNWAAFADFIEQSTTATKLKEEVKHATKDGQKKSELKKAEESVKEAEGKLKDVIKEADQILNTKRAADIAMFGRMITSEPKYNIDAASQVAHALSTNIVNDAEIDYFTALDELKDPKNPGAAHINTAEFNSACYYRYANVDVGQLKDNLKDGDSTLAKKTLEAFLQAFVLAVPSGKQNSFASPTPPSLVLAVIRQHSLCSLANAFEQPISQREREEAGVIGSSIRRLTSYFDKLEKLYGDYNPSQGAFVFTEASEYIGCPVKQVAGDDKADIKTMEVASLKGLIEKVVAKAFPGDSQTGEDGQ